MSSRRIGSTEIAQPDPASENVNGKPELRVLAPQ